MEEIMKTIMIYRPSWVEPEYLAGLGYKLISDAEGYLKYSSYFNYKALHRAGRKHEQRLGNDKRIIYFNLTFSPEEQLVFCCIKEDGDSRTVYNGVLTEETQLKLILSLVE